MDAGLPGSSNLRARRVFTHAKREGEANEDRWGISDDGLICAVSDGASVSYDPGPWASELVSRFVVDQNLSVAWVREAVDAYTSRYDREAMTWSQQGAFDRGSSASLVSVVCDAGGTVANVWCLGDSLAALIIDDILMLTAPYDHADQFDQAPRLFSTNPLENRWIDDKAIQVRWLRWPLPEVGAVKILLMTDALGRWLLEAPSRERIAMLCDFEDDDRFAEFVEEERAAGRLRRDDTTLAIFERLP